MLITGNPKKDEMIKTLTLLLEEDGFFIENIEAKTGLAFKKGNVKGIVGPGQYICIHDIHKDDICCTFSVVKNNPIVQSCISDFYSNYEFAFSFITTYYKFILEILNDSPGLTFRLHFLTNLDFSCDFIMIGYDKFGMTKKTIYIGNIKPTILTATT